MSSRALYDSVGSYREATDRMQNSPKDTFMCNICKNFKLILGRKLVAKDGNRRTYACAKCAVPK